MKKVKARGDEMPAIGMGTWQLQDETLRAAVRAALQIGYRHIDTAQAYENEAEVGEAIRDSDVAREDIWITTKVWWKKASRDDVLRSTERSLERLGLDRVDLLLLHWPNPEVDLDETLGALVELKEEGRARQIGVSNFPSALLRRAADRAPVFCNQVEYHPFLDQSAVLEACRAAGVVMTAYSPLAQTEVMGSRVLRAIGDAHGKSPGQVALRWLVQQDGVAAIPRSSSPEHLRENFDVFDFELSPEQMKAVDALRRRDHRLIDPSFAPDWD